MARVALSQVGSAFAHGAAPRGHTGILTDQLFHRQTIFTHRQGLQHTLTSPRTKLCLALPNFLHKRLLIGLDLLELALERFTVYLMRLLLLLVLQALRCPVVRLRQSFDA